jgi:transporter family-2 protein
MISIRLALWAALAGGLIPVMAVLNGRLGRALGNSLHAPVILMVVGLLTSLAICLALTYRLPDLGSLTSSQPIDYVGGLIVCFYVVSATLLAPRLGVGNFILFAVVAQIVTSALIDHFGLLGVLVREISWTRLFGILIVIAGLIITQMSKTEIIASN